MKKRISKEARTVIEKFIHYIKEFYPVESDGLRFFVAKFYHEDTKSGHKSDESYYIGYIPHLKKIYVHLNKLMTMDKILFEMATAFYLYLYFEHSGENVVEDNVRWIQLADELAYKIQKWEEN